MVVAAFILTFLKHANIGGALPVVLIYGGMCALAKLLCKEYEASQCRHSGSAISNKSENGNSECEQRSTSDEDNVLLPIRDSESPTGTLAEEASIPTPLSPPIEPRINQSASAMTDITEEGNCIPEIDSSAVIEHNVNTKTDSTVEPFVERNSQQQTCSKKINKNIEIETKARWKAKFARARNFKKPLTIILSVLCILLIGLNVFQYIRKTEQSAKIEELEKTIASLKIVESSQKSKIASLEKKTIRGDYFDTLCNELSSGNLGFASNHFKASESIIVVSKNDMNRKFTLTANWSNGGTVAVDYSGNSAYVFFDHDSWSTSTTMTITPVQEGITTVYFSNDADFTTFKILIIVTE